MRLARLKGGLVDLTPSGGHVNVYKLARTQRDAWLNWPAHVFEQLVSDLNVDASANAPGLGEGGAWEFAGFGRDGEVC